MVMAICRSGWRADRSHGENLQADSLVPVNNSHGRAEMISHGRTDADGVWCVSVETGLDGTRACGVRAQDAVVLSMAMANVATQEKSMRARRYSIPVLAALLAACGSTVPVGAADEAPVSEAFTQSDAAGSPGQASARDVPFAEPTVSLPKPLIGLWAVSSDVCQSPDGEGWTRISENLLTGYEVALRPIEIKSVGEHAWTIESEENYLGTQFAMVRQTLSLGATLTVQPEGEQLERYLRCGE